MLKLDIEPETLECLEYIGFSKRCKLKEREATFVKEGETDEPDEDFKWFDKLSKKNL